MNGLVISSHSIIFVLFFLCVYDEKVYGCRFPHEDWGRVGEHVLSHSSKHQQQQQQRNEKRFIIIIIINGMETSQRIITNKPLLSKMTKKKGQSKKTLLNENNEIQKEKEKKHHQLTNETENPTMDCGAIYGTVFTQLHFYSTDLFHYHHHNLH